MIQIVFFWRTAAGWVKRDSGLLHDGHVCLALLLLFNGQVELWGSDLLNSGQMWSGSSFRSFSRLLFYDGSHGRWYEVEIWDAAIALELLLLNQLNVKKHYKNNKTNVTLYAQIIWVSWKYTKTI